MGKNLERMYNDVPPTYEFLNHLLTFGQDVFWRRKAAQIATAAGGDHWLDFGCGTAEMSTNLVRRANANTRIVAADFSLPMMRKALTKPEAERINFTLVEATHLPFANSTFDVITISFAARNIHSSGEGNLQKCFEEFHRILKPEGIVVSLESSQPANRITSKLFHLYVKLMVKPVGRIISGSSAPYDYLSRSMRQFYTAQELAAVIRRSGFSMVSHKPLFFGAAAIHRAAK